ncbi:MAG: IS1 family transposase [Gemmatimonadota bacterium]
MANVLKREKQEAVIRCLVNGSSVRATERMAGVRDTVIRLMKRIGAGCEQIMDSEMRHLECRHLQLDEIWAFVGKKQRWVTRRDDPRQVGDFYTFVALDEDTRLIPTYKVGKRDKATTEAFIADLASRLAIRPQISADGFWAYVEAIDRSFGADVDFAQIVKFYEAEPIGPGRYSPPKVVDTEKRIIWGDPDPDRISTSYVERQNLTMRMNMRRLTRLTNGFSKSVISLRAAVALYFGHYNFVRIHRSLRTTPAMAAGATTKLWTIGDLVDSQESSSCASM